MKRTAAALLLLLFPAAVWAAEIEFSGEASLVSTYVFRGLKQFEGAALQSTAEFAYGPLTVGLWMSSMNELTVENDPYASFALPTGPVESSIGVTLYSYDFFSRREYSVYELSVTAAYGPAQAAFYYSPKQKFTKNGSEIELIPDPLYWFELSAATTFKGADLSAGIGYGTYSAFFTTGGNSEATSCLLLSAGKKITQSLSASWNWSIAMDEYTDNVFFVKVGYEF